MTIDQVVAPCYFDRTGTLNVSAIEVKGSLTHFNILSSAGIAYQNTEWGAGARTLETAFSFKAF